MVYSLQKFRHYLLGGLFKFFTNHSNLKYLVNKRILEGRICKWIFLFQEFTFEVIVKPVRFMWDLIISQGWDKEKLEDTLMINYHMSIYSRLNKYHITWRKL